MSFWAIFVIAIGLSMDAFAVSVCKGLGMQRISYKKMGIIGLWFGGFQALMPLIGYLLGSSFEHYITSIDHWIAFVLLSIIGSNMIREGWAGDDSCPLPSTAPRDMLPLALATSMDALAVGITLAFLQVQILPSVATIGMVTFLLSLAGVKVGNIFGIRYKSKAELLGGVLLILMGIHILLSHLGII